MGQNDPQATPLRARLMRKLVISIVAEILLLAVVVFAAAGTLAWWHGWLFIAIFAVGTVASSAGILRADPDLMAERLSSPIQKAQSAADKFILPAMLAGFLAVLVLAPLDVFRLHLLPRASGWASSFGLLIFIAGWWIAYIGLRANAFAAPVVKIQAERAQVVVDTGPYAIVRHPMYAGGLLVFFGMPLSLESYAATLLAIVPATLVVARILVEERLLRHDLPGYADYAQRVHYRLIPFLW